MTPRDEHFDFDNTAGRPGLPWALAAAAVALLMCAAMASSSPDAAGRCDGLANETARLACYDAAAKTQPAKGAFTPNS